MQRGAGNPEPRKMRGAYTRARPKNRNTPYRRFWYSASSERIQCPPSNCNYLAFSHKGEHLRNTVLSLSGYQASLLAAQSVPLRGSLGRSNQRGSEPSQASYGHPRCDLNHVRVCCLSLPSPVFGLLFSIPSSTPPSLGGKEGHLVGTTSAVVCYTINAATSTYSCMYGHTYSKSMDQPGMVVSPARGQLKRENRYFPVRVRA